MEPFVDYNVKSETTELTTTHHYSRPTFPVPRGQASPSFEIFGNNGMTTHSGYFSQITCSEALHCVLEQDASVIGGVGRAARSRCATSYLGLRCHFEADDKLQV